AAVAAGDAAFANRVDRAQLELAIAKYEEAVKLKDDDWQTYGKLARACYALADQWLLFEKDTNPQPFMDFHSKGLEYAQRGMAALSPDVEKRLAAGVDLKDAVQLLDKQAIDLLYWHATNLGRWANAQDITVVLSYKERIYNIMEMVLRFDPNYFYGAADRYFGAYFSIAPSFAGGDLDKSESHFQASLKIAPNYASTHILMAEFLAPKKQDVKMFDDAIARVLAMPDDIIPEVTAETVAEKKKAQLLVKRKADGEFPF
ncbi:MAG: TRAP transporter TatT component family protein, partial [Deltaproteobacteria bacterium]|nr:TRAP transporter TatT component family protein [Kofleriaceae bacterium]